MKVKVSSAVENFIYSLDKITIAKALRTIDLLEKFGYRLGMPHSKKLEKNLYELRTRGKQEVRIFYTFYKSKAILFYAYVKKTQRTPQKELNKARGELKRILS